MPTHFVQRIEIYIHFFIFRKWRKKLEMLVREI